MNNTFFITIKTHVTTILLLNLLFVSSILSAAPVCEANFTGVNGTTVVGSPTGAGAKLSIVTLKNSLGENYGVRFVLTPDGTPGIKKVGFRETFKGLPTDLGTSLGNATASEYHNDHESMVDWILLPPYPADGTQLNINPTLGWRVEMEDGTIYEPWVAGTSNFNYTLGSECAEDYSILGEACQLQILENENSALLTIETLGSPGNYTGLKFTLEDGPGEYEVTSWRNLGVSGFENMPDGTSVITGRTFTYTFNTPIAETRRIYYTTTEWNTLDGGGATHGPWQSRRRPYTIGSTCSYDEEPPVVNCAGVSASFISEKGGILNVSATDNTKVAQYRIVNNPQTYSIDVPIAYPSASHTGQVTFSLPAGQSIANNTVLRVYAIDYSGNVSTSYCQLTVSPTNYTVTTTKAECGTTKATSLELVVDGTSSNPISQVTQYRVVYTSAAGNGDVILPADVQSASKTVVKLENLAPLTTYNMQVYAVDQMGKQATTPISVSCTTEELVSPYCGQILSSELDTYTSLNAQRSRVLTYMSRTSDEITLLVTSYPGTPNIAGLVIESNVANSNPDGGTFYMNMIPNATSYMDPATLASNNSTASAQVVNVQLEGYSYTQPAIKFTFKYNTASAFDRFYLRWYKENDVSTPGAYTFNEWISREAGYTHGYLQFNVDELYCPMANQTTNLPVVWDDNGSRTEVDTPTNLPNNPNDTSDNGLLPCGNLIFSTSFSSSSYTTTNMTLEEIDYADPYGLVSEISAGAVFPNMYSNGNFMNAGSSYAIVSNPKVLDKNLSRRDDGNNRLVYNLPYAFDAENQMLLLSLQYLQVGTDVTVEFDIEDVSPDCEYATYSHALRCGLSQTTQDFTLKPNEKKHIAMSAAVTQQTSDFLNFYIATWNTTDCEAVAISNLKVYGCPKTTIKKQIPGSDFACELQDYTLTAFGFQGRTTGFKWEESLDGQNWTTLSETSEVLTIVPQLAVSKYYRVSNPSLGASYKADSVLIVGTVCCSGKDEIEVWSEDFGTVGEWERKSIEQVSGDGTFEVEGHSFEDFMYFCGRGDYNNIVIDGSDATCGYGSCNWVWLPPTGTVMQADGVTPLTRTVDGVTYYNCAEISGAVKGSKPYYFGNGYSKIEDGGYAIVSNSTYADDWTGWPHNRTDHTGNANGGFLLINVAGTAVGIQHTKILEKEITTPLCANVRYNFTMWASQLAAPTLLPSSFQFIIEGLVDGNWINLGSQTTGDMRVYRMESWEQYGTSFETLGASRVRLSVYNVGAAGAGNDLVIDDLRLTTCSPEVALSSDHENFTGTSLEGLCGESVEVHAEFNSGGVKDYFKLTPSYVLQRYNGSVWKNVQGPTNDSVFSVTLTEGVTTGKYRLIVAGDEITATQVSTGTSVSGDCALYAISNEIDLTCHDPACADPIVTLSSTPTVCLSSTVPLSLTASVSFTGPNAGTASVSKYEWASYNELSDTWNTIVTNSTTAVTNVVTVAMPNKAGNFKYRVTVYNKDQKELCFASEEYTVKVVANPVPVLDFVDKNTLTCKQTILTMSASPVSGVTYTWSAGATAATANSATVTTDGTYSVTVTNTDGCIGTAELAVTKNIENPTVTIPTVDDLTCATTALQRTLVANASANVTYAWSAGGTASSKLITAGGTYSVTVEDKTNGCTATSSVSVSQSTVSPTVTINNTAVLNCEVTTVTVTAQATADGTHTVSYLWNDASNATASTLNITDNNTYRVTVTDNVNQCQSTASVSVSQDVNVPTIDIPSVGQLDCVNTIRTITANVTAYDSHAVLYEWNDGVSGTSDTRNVTSSGVYSVTVTDDSNKCTVSSSISVSQNASDPTVSILDVTDLTCANESVVLTASVVGSVNFNYKWDGGSETQTYMVTAPGTYSVTVTDTDSQCKKIASYTVGINNTKPTVTISVGTDNVLNCAVSSVTLTANGATTEAGHTLSYLWNDGAASTTSVLTVTSPNNYQVIVTDDQNGCVGSVTYIVNKDINAPTVNITSASKKINCVTKTISATAVAGAYGTHTVSYNWSSNAETTSVLTITSGDTYTVTVTDDVNKCTASNTIVIDQDESLPTITIPSVETLNCAVKTQTLSVSVSTTGTPSVSYSWSKDGTAIGGISSTIIVTAGGVYEVTVTDLNSNCPAVKSYTVNQNTVSPTIGISLPVESVINCAVDNVMLTATSSAASVTYVWNDDAHTANSTVQVSQGKTYIVTGTDQTNMCTSISSVTIVEDKNLPTVIIPTIGKIDCVTQTQTLSVNHTAYNDHDVTYEWSAGVSDANIQNPTVTDDGVYTVTVTDVINNCSNTASVSVEKSVSVPTLQITGGTQLDCGAATLTLKAEVAGAAGGVSYKWSTAATDTKEFILADNIGVYSVTVTDNVSKCEVVTSTEVTRSLVYPTVTVNVDKDINCSVNEVVVTATASTTIAGHTFTYDWSDALSTQNSTLTINNTDVYSVTVTDDQNHCTASTTVQVNEDKNVPVINVPSVDQLDCTNLSRTVGVEVTTIAGHTYTYNWERSSVQVSTDQSFAISDAGIYKVTVIDAVNFCSATSQVEVVKDTNLPVLNVSKSNDLDCSITEANLSASVSGSTSVNYLWSTAANTSVITVTAGNTYSVSVTDTNSNCQVSTEITVAQSTVSPTVTISKPATNDVFNCDVREVIVTATASSSLGNPIVYAWSDAASTEGEYLTITDGNVYTVTARDFVNSCEAQTTVSISGDYAVPTVAIGNVDPIDCVNTQQLLTATANLANGRTTVSYLWSNTSTGSSLNVTKGGVYVVSATDETNQCIGTTAITVTEALGRPTVTFAPVEELNCETTQVVVSANVASNTANLTYAWSNGITGANSIVVTVGDVYGITVTDEDSHCTTNDAQTVSQSTVSPTISISYPTEDVLNCKVSSVIVTANGSTTVAGHTVSYKWSSSEVVASKTITDTNVYTVVVTDDNNKCSVETVASVLQDVATPTIGIPAVPQVDCKFTAQTLTVTVNASGHATSYLWSTSATDTQNTLVVTSGNTYEVTVTDTENFCSSVTNLVVAESSEKPVVTIPTQDVITCKVTNVTATINANPVIAGHGLSYQWDGGSTSSTANITSTGTYAVVVKDIDNECTSTVSVTISDDIEKPEVKVLANNALDCDNSTVQISATYTLTNSGNTVTYNWSTGESTSTATANAPTTYTVTVTDNGNGCSETASATVEISTVSPTIVIPAVPQIDCNNPTQKLTVAMTLITPESSPSYEWNGSATDSKATFVATTSGTYTVKVRDSSNGCIGTAEQTVVVNNGVPTITIPAVDQIDCQTTSTVLLVNAALANVADAQYKWNDAANTQTSSLTVTEAGTYQVTVTDTNNGCYSVTNQVVVKNVNSPKIGIPTVNVLDCVNLSQTLTVTGNATTPTYTWSVTGQTASTLVVSEAGTYTVSVVDQVNGCSASTTQTVGINTVTPVVTIPTVSQIDCRYTSRTLKPVVMLPNAGATATYAWSNGTSDKNLVVIDNQVYSVSVTDSKNGCVGTASASVVVNVANPTVTIPTVSQIDCQVVEQTLTASVSTSAATTIAYAWNVVGNKTSTMTVTEGGVYSVEVTDKGNYCTATAEVLVVKDVEMPTVDIPAVAQIDCINTSQILTANAHIANTNIQYIWNDNSNNQTLTVTTSGTYSVTVKDLDNKCSVETSRVVTKDTQVPTVTIPAVAQIDCANPNRTLSANAQGKNLTYSWSNGDTKSTLVVADNKVYSVTVTDNDNGCIQTASQSVAVNTVSPTIVIPTVERVDCTNPSQVLVAQVTIANSAAIKYLWSEGATQSTMTVTEAGTYTVSATDTNNGCQQTASQTVSKDIEAPDVTIVPHDGTELTCTILTITLDAENGVLSNGKTVSKYEWSNGETTSQNIISQPNDYNVKLTYSNGCTASATIKITQDVVPTTLPPIKGSKLYCEGDAGQMIATPAGGVWSSNNENILTIATDGTLQTLKGGSSEITYTYTNPDNGCVSTVTASIKVDSNPNPVISDDQEICAGEEVTLHVDGGENYLWSPAETLSNKKTTNPVAKPTETTTYKVALINGVCLVEEEVTVFVNPLPVLSANVDSKNTVILSTESGTGPFQYSIDGGTYSSQESYTGVKGGNHMAYVVDTKGCESEAPFYLEYLDVIPPIFFTPNGDGENDTWEVENLDMYPEADVYIYDRYGKLMTRYKGADPGWDGTYRGKPQPSTDYWFIIKIDMTDKKVTGHFTLKR